MIGSDLLGVGLLGGDVTEQGNSVAMAGTATGVGAVQDAALDIQLLNIVGLAALPRGLSAVAGTLSLTARMTAASSGQATPVGNLVPAIPLAASAAGQAGVTANADRVLVLATSTSQAASVFRGLLTVTSGTTVRGEGRPEPVRRQARFSSYRVR